MCGGGSSGRSMRQLSIVFSSFWILTLTKTTCVEQFMFEILLQAAALSYPINALVTPAAWHTELPQGKQKLPQVDIRIGTPIWNHHFFNGFNLSIVRFTCRDTASNRTTQYVISMFQMHFPNGTLQKPSFRQIHEQTRKQNPPAWHSDLPQGKEVTPDGGSYWHRHLEV